MGTSKPFVLLRTLLKHSFVSNFFSKLKARVVTQFLWIFFSFARMSSRRIFCPKSSAGWLQITGLEACGCLMVL